MGKKKAGAKSQALAPNKGELLKEAGNQAFSKKMYSEAIELYS